MMGDLSKHFDTTEFACRHCGRCSVSGELITALEELRTAVDLPVYILSGYRCPEDNKEVGGAQHSQHVLGLAADIRIPTLTLQQMYDAAKNVPAFKYGGIGVYDGKFLHVDVRDGAARWARVKGKYLGAGELVTV